MMPIEGAGSSSENISKRGIHFIEIDSIYATISLIDPDPHAPITAS